MADRHNLCTNPAAKNNVTGWGGGSTPAQQDVTGLGFDRTTAARYTSGTYCSTATGTVSPATEYTLSVYLRPASNSSGTLYIEWTRSSGGPTYTSTAYTATAGAVTRVSITGTSPALAIAAGIVLDGVNYAFNTTDVTMVLVEQAGTLDTYFDGDSDGASWDGADGSSASTLSAAVVGTVAAPLGGLTLAAAGEPVIVGTMAASLGALTVAVTGETTMPELDGTLSVSGSLAGTLSVSGALAGTLAVSGQLAGTLS